MSDVDTKNKLIAYIEYLSEQIDNAFGDISEIKKILEETNNFESKANNFISNKGKIISFDDISFDEIKKIKFK